MVMTVHEAANGASPRPPPVANIDDLEDRECRLGKNRYSMLMARLRIVQASAIDPRQIAQAVQAAQAGHARLMSLSTNSDLLPRITPRALRGTTGRRHGTGHSQVCSCRFHSRCIWYTHAFR
jgi:hypothetical protein